MPTKQNKHSKNNGRSGLFAHSPRTIYLNKKELFDKASESAFLNIQYLEKESEPLDNQVIVFNVTKQVIVICITNLVEKKTNLAGFEKRKYFLWEVSTYAVIKTPKDVSGRLMRSEEWNRRIAIIIKSVTKGALSGVNPKHEPSFAMDRNIYKGYVIITPEDREVIRVAQAEDGNEQGDLQSNKTLEAVEIVDDNLSPKEQKHVKKIL